MGNTNKKNSLYDDVLSLTYQKISKSANPKVLSLYIDNAQYPESGMIAVGNEFVENYSEAKSTLYTSHQSSSKILSSCFFNTTISEIHGKKEKNEPTLILSLENQQLEFIHGKTMISFKNYTPILKLTDVVFPNEEIELISTNPEPFKSLFVDTLLTLDDTQFLVGFANGFVQRISLPNTIILKTYNPLLFQKEEMLKEKIEDKSANSEKKEEVKEENKEQQPLENEQEVSKKEKTVIFDNFLLPGIDSLGYCSLHEILFVNHRNFDKNTYNRTFALEETPIFSYKLNGEKHLRLRNCSGTILQNAFLDNRGLYLVLTSANQIFVWNFLSNTMILKISLDNLGMKGGAETFFTTLAVRSYDINQRGITADKVFDFSHLKNPKQEFKSIDGDLIFTAERNGGFLISKLTFENEKNEVSWVPMKIFDMRDKDVQQSKSKVLKSIKNIQNNISVLLFDRFQDNLYMIDHKSSVRIFKRITQKMYSP